MLKSLFCEVISVEYEFNSVKFKGGGGSIDLKMNNLDLRGNTTEFKTLPTRPRSHRYILFIYSRWNLSKFVLFKTFLVRIFARKTLLLFRCFNIHVKMCILLSYCARE